MPKQSPIDIGEPLELLDLACARAGTESLMLVLDQEFLDRRLT